MPSIMTSKLLPPHDWKEFESMTRDALIEKWDSLDLEINGRQGQDQAGVDIYGENHKGKFVGVQCKNTDNLNFQTVIAEAQKAESFKPAIQVFYIATTGKRDGALQKSVRLENIKRKVAGKFKIRLLFWEDIQSELAKNIRLIQKYYSQYIINLEPHIHVKGNRKVSVLDLGFYGLHIRGIMGISFGEWASTEQDIREFSSMLDLLEEAILVITNSEQLPKRIEALTKFRGELNRIVEGKVKGWKSANKFAEQLEDSIRNLTRWLDSEEYRIFRIGGQLGTWDYFDLYHYQETYSKDKLDKLADRIKEVLNIKDLPKEIDQYINDYLNPESEIGKASSAPTKTFNWLRQYYMTN